MMYANMGVQKKSLKWPWVVVIFLLFLILCIEAFRLYITIETTGSFRKAGDHISSSLDSLGKQEKVQYDEMTEFSLIFADKLLAQLQNITSCICGAA